MAGSEQTGVRAARADLFCNAACMVTPGSDAEPGAVEEICAFWKRLGCRVRTMSPQQHDELVAAISHLPHLVAAALVNSISTELPDALDMAGPGFKDTTRVASGPPDMWTEIFTTNRSAVRKSAEAMIAKLEQFIRLLERESPESELLMNEFLTQAKNRRDRVSPREPRFPERS
jgi:prephenate dehydrogenase